MPPTAWPPWVVMLVLAVAVYAACKWLTWWRTPAPTAPTWRHAAYLLAWPGMDAKAFLDPRPLPRDCRPAPGEWAFAAAKLALSVLLMWLAVPHVPTYLPILRGWVGMTGLIFLLQFGIFHLLSCTWRAAGVNARPLMNWPVLSVRLSEFWGRRWNTAFRDLAHRFLFCPLSKWFGARAGIAAGFLFSGLVHDLVISVPAGAGYGWPTLYFALQGLALLAERSKFGKALGLGEGWQGRLYTAIVTAGPACGLFHPAFVLRVVLPFLAAMGISFTEGEPMDFVLANLIRLAGVGQLCVLVASALVPIRLHWKRDLAPLPTLHRQLVWTYGGYVVLAIIALGAISLVCADELAAGSGLARAVCAYAAVFWAVRLGLQAVFDVKPHLTAHWLTVGYHTLTALFLFFTTVFAYAALR